VRTNYTYLANLAKEVEIPKDGIISRTLYSDDRIKTVLFGFSAGQELSEHTAAHPTILYFVRGEADLTLGEEALAWDYLTTPLALKPNEAAPWRSLAETLGSEQEYELADRAYAAAFEAEPTNADLLWDHIQLLQEAGRRQEADKLLKQLAEDNWQPRFQHLQKRAAELISQ